MNKWIFIVVVSLISLYLVSLIDEKDSSDNVTQKKQNVVLQNLQSSQNLKSSQNPKSENIDITTPSQKPEQLELEDSLARYQDMEPADILKELSVLSKQDSSNISQVLLSLIEKGYLDPHSSLRAEGDHYTPLYAAVSLDHRLSLEQVRLFLSMGSDFTSMYENDKRPWMSAIGRENNTDVAKFLLEQIDYSNDEAEKMATWAFSAGNTETYNYLGNHQFISKNKEHLHKVAFNNSDKLSNFYRSSNSIGIIKNHSKVWLEKGSEEYQEWLYIESDKVASRFTFLLSDNSLDENTRSRLEESLRTAESIRDNLLHP